MSYRKAQNLDKNIIFQEYFNDEQSVRRNGGVPTDVTFNKGVAEFNGTSSQVLHGLQNLSTTNIFSVRLRLNFNNVADHGIWGKDDEWTYALRIVSGVAYHGARAVSGTLDYSDRDTEIIITRDGGSSAIMYQDGVLLGTATSITTDIILNTLGRTNSVYGSADISLAEIYNKALTAEEVSNLYNDARYVLPELEHEEQLGVQLALNPSFDTWTGDDPDDWSVANEDANNYVTEHENGAHWVYNVTNPTVLKMYSTVDDVTVPGTLYKRVITISDYVEGAIVAYAGISVQELGDIDGNGVWTFYFLAEGSSTRPHLYRVGGSDADMVIVSDMTYEVTVEETKKILEVTAKDGVARNLLSGDVHGGNIALNSFDWVGASGATPPTGWSNLRTAVFSLVDGILEIAQGVTDSYWGIEDSDLVTSGKTYRIGYKTKATIGDIHEFDLGSVQQTINGTGNWVEGNFIITADSTSLALKETTGAQNPFYVDYITVEEIIPEVTNTDIEVVKDSPGLVPRFKATTNKIDLGDYNDLIGDITILMWIRPSSFGVGTNNGHLICNKPLIADAGLLVRWSADQVQITSNSDSGTAVGTSFGFSTSFNEYHLVALVRTSAGLVTAYVNGEQNGADGGDSGNPQVGETNIIIGNNTGQIRPYAGDIPGVTVLSGLLTAEEISQYYTATKHLYNK